MPCGLFFAVNYFFKNVLTEKTTFFFVTKNFFQVILARKIGIFSLFFRLFRVKKRNFQHERALEHGAAPSEKPFAAAFWRAAFFMKMSKTIVLQKFSVSQIFQIFFFTFSVLNRACARTWLFFDHVG
jgi:hypothetical protein